MAAGGIKCKAEFLFFPGETTAGVSTDSSVGEGCNEEGINPQQANSQGKTSREQANSAAWNCLSSSSSSPFVLLGGVRSNFNAIYNYYNRKCSSLKMKLLHQAEPTGSNFSVNG